MRNTPATRAFSTGLHVLSAFQAFNIITKSDMSPLLFTFGICLSSFLIPIVLSKMIPNTPLQPSGFTSLKRRGFAYVALHGVWQLINVITFYVALLKLHPLRLIVGEFLEVGILALWMHKLLTGGGGTTFVWITYTAGLCLLGFAGNLYNYGDHGTLPIDSVGGMTLLILYCFLEVLRKRFRYKITKDVSSSSDSTIQCLTFGVATFALFPFVFVYCSFTPTAFESLYRNFHWIIFNATIGTVLPYALDLAMSKDRRADVPTRGAFSYQGVHVVPSHVRGRHVASFVVAYVLHFVYHTHYIHLPKTGETVAEETQQQHTPHFILHMDNFIVMVSFVLMSLAVRGALALQPSDERSNASSEFDTVFSPLLDPSHDPSLNPSLTSKQKKLLAYLFLNVAFMLIELIYGIHSNSLGLVSDSFHMLLDSASIGIGLYAAHMATWRANNVFTYGYGRYEILSGFTNGVLLVLIAFFVFLESVGRLLDPPEVDSEWLFLISALGCGVNVIGVVFFHEAHAGHGHSCSSHGHSHAPAPSTSSASTHHDCSGHDHGHDHGHSHESHDHGHHHGHDDHHGHHDCHGHSHGSTSSEMDDVHVQHTDHNMWGVFIHICADLLGSLGVMVSSLIVKHTGFMIADPICSTIISILILLSSIPLLTATGSLLLQRVPSNYIAPLRRFTDDVSRKQGVVQVKDIHLWQHATTPELITVLTLHVVVDKTQEGAAEEVRNYVQEAVRKRGLCTEGYLGVQITGVAGDARHMVRGGGNGASDRRGSEVTLLLS